MGSGALRPLLPPARGAFDPADGRRRGLGCAGVRDYGEVVLKGAVSAFLRLGHAGA